MLYIWAVQTTDYLISCASAWRFVTAHPKHSKVKVNFQPAHTHAVVHALFSRVPALS